MERGLRSHWPRLLLSIPFLRPNHHSTCTPSLSQPSTLIPTQECSLGNLADAGRCCLYSLSYEHSPALSSAIKICPSTEIAPLEKQRCQGQVIYPRSRHTPGQAHLSEGTTDTQTSGRTLELRRVRSAWPQQSQTKQKVFNPQKNPDLGREPQTSFLGTFEATGGSLTFDVWSTFPEHVLNQCTLG